MSNTLKNVPCVVRKGHPSYPTQLLDVRSPPKQLFVLGEVAALSSKPMVAVVGTRKISDYGRQVLYFLIPPLVKAGVTIVSGLALGIDGLAHEIALEHGGKCIAVLGNGLDEIYPREHQDLAERILSAQGTIISEQEGGVKPLRQFFPARNRIISGLAKTTIVVEAQHKSGSLITARFALEQQRTVYAVPGSIFGENQQGVNALIADGAKPFLSVDQVLQELYGSIPVMKELQGKLSFESPDEESIYGLLNEPRSLDELSATSNFTMSTLNQTLSLMELKGSIRSVGGMRFIRI